MLNDDPDKELTFKDKDLILARSEDETGESTGKKGQSEKHSDEKLHMKPASLPKSSKARGNAKTTAQTAPQQKEADFDIDNVSDSDASMLDPASAMADNLPERYEVLSVLGEGGTGAVFKVFDKILNQTFAVKMLRPHLIDDKKALGRFQEEARSAKNMTHVNLAAVYDYGVGKHGAPYLVMDYLEGKSLEKIIKEENGIAVPRAIDLFIQITEAIGHAHAKGLIHRDVKPSNIIIESNAQGVELVKLVDFGIAKSLLGANSMQRTRTGDVIGSPPYMAPEQCEGTKLDVRADIYSLGCVMYETLCGHAPFTGKNAIQIILKHIKETPVPVSQACTEQKVPDDLNYIVMRCLQKERWQRYQNIGELRADLERFKSHKPIKHFAPTEPGPQPKPSPGPKAARLDPGWMGLGLLIYFCIVAVASFVQFTINHPPTPSAVATAPVSYHETRDNASDEMRDYDLERGLAPNPQLDAQKVWNLATRFEQLNQPKKAIPLFQFASRIFVFGERDYTVCQKHLGDCYYNLGNYQDALKSYQSTLKSFDKSPLKDQSNYAGYRAKIVQLIKICSQE